jgi:FMN-dependent NADH-azoreductase
VKWSFPSVLGSGAGGWDHQGRYLEHIIGFSGIRKILVEPTEAKPTC